jgi:ketosteroid isomerase-like protein
VSFDLAREYAEAMKAHDLDQVASLLDPDATVVTPKGTVLHGPDEVRRYFGGGGFDHLEVETVHDDFQTHGKGVRVRARQIFRWKESGEHAFERPLAFHFEFQDGRITRLEMTLAQEPEGLETPSELGAAE